MTERLRPRRPRQYIKNGLVLLGGWCFPVSGKQQPALLGAYLVLNVVCSVHLKHIVILDVVIIFAGLMPRVLAGTLGLGITPYDWLPLLESSCISARGCSMTTAR